MTRYDTFLARCQTLDEDSFCATIIRPFLEECGAVHIQYVCGQRELGKDFYYLIKNEYGKEELHVIQAKNKPLTANFSGSDSIATLLNQVETAATNKIAHPRNHRLQAPDKVLAINSHAVPDPILMGHNDRIEKIGPVFHLYDGHAFAELVEKKAPKLFGQITGNSNRLLEWIRNQVHQHPEARIFFANATDTSRMFVDLSVRLVTRHLVNTLNSISPLQDYPRLSLRHQDARDVQLLGKNIADLFGVVTGFSCPETEPLVAEEGPSDAVAKTADQYDKIGDLIREVKPEDRPGNGWYRDCNIRAMVERAAKKLKEFNLAATNPTDLVVNLELLQLAVSRIGEKTAGADGHFEQSKPDKAVTSLEESLVFTKDSWEKLLCTLPLVVVSGQPGVGKTVLARRLALTLMESGNNVVYFPCSRISTSSQDLRSAMQAFVREICELDEPAAQRVLDAATVFVLDGLDEASSMSSRLLGDVKKLVFPSPIEQVQSIPTSSPVGDGRVPVPALKIPNTMYDAITVTRRERDNAVTVTLKRRLTVGEEKVLRLAAEDVPYADAVRSILERHDRLPRVIVTCRQSVLRGLRDSGSQFDGFVRAKVEAFDDRQLQEFFERWGRACGVDVRELISLLNADDNKKIKEVCKTPINAAIMFGVHAQGIPLPRNRESLYTRRFDLLAEGWDIDRKIPPRNRIGKDFKLRFCYLLALDTHLRRRTSFASSDAGRIWNARFRGASGGYAVEELLKELKEANGLIVERSCGVMEFGHLSFQEYLAARGVHQLNLGKKLASKFNDPWWRNVIVFYTATVDSTGEFLRAVHECGAISAESMPLIHEIESEGGLDTGLRSLIAEIGVADWGYDDDDSFDVGFEQSDYDSEGLYDWSDRADGDGMSASGGD